MKHIRTHPETRPFPPEASAALGALSLRLLKARAAVLCARMHVPGADEPREERMQSAAETQALCEMALEQIEGAEENLETLDRSRVRRMI